MAAALALVNSGCGGGQAPPPPAPPPPITVAVSPTPAIVQVNSTAQFTATVMNDSATRGVTWSASCSAAPCGSVAPTSTASAKPITYTAPATVPANPLVTITATSAADVTKSASAAVTVTLPELNPTSLDFMVRVGHSSPPKSATLTSTGNTPLSIGSIAITGMNPSNFSQTNTCGTSLGAGKSCIITVTFTPTAQASYHARVSIADNSGGSPQQLSLAGSVKSGAKHALRRHSALVGMYRTAIVPTPTGSSHVGTRVMDVVDSTRDDPYLSNGTPRELLVRFWYPASRGQDCKLAEYTSPAVWSYFSQLAAIPLPEVRTNSCLDVPITEDRHPVVVFTHGYTGTFTDYTFIFEDLASRGYVVASVDHTYEATAVAFPDGRFVKSVLGSHLGDPWRVDDQALSFATSVRLEDLKFVVTEMERLNAQSDGPFAGKLDMSDVALAGHSLGGLAALLGIEEEPRFKVGIIIDGYVPDALVRATETPILIVAAGREQWSEGERGLWNNLRGPRLALNLRGAEHVTPSDLVWLAKGAVKTGAMGPEKTIAAVRDYIAAFLDANLRGKPASPLLTAASSEYPDAVITTQRESLRDEGKGDSAP